MANPVPKDCPANVWTKVATNVTGGHVHKQDETPLSYLQMYKLTGDPAPTDIDEGIKIFIGSDLSEEISSVDSIDVYIYCLSSPGRVRVDI